MIILGVTLFIVATLTGGVAQSSGGIVILIGPFPIGIGWGSFGPVLIIVALLAALLMIFVAYIMVRATIKLSRE